MGQDIDSRRADHMDSLRGALIARRRATRAQLSEDTGLSTMTVGKLLAQMQRCGEVRQDETVSAPSGRPSTIAAYNGEYAHFATISVVQRGGRGAFTCSVYNLFGERVRSDELLLDSVREDSFDPWLEDVTAQGYRLRLLALALPGEAEGDCVFISDFEALLYDRFLPRLRRKFGVETLFENDVNAAVFGHVFEEEGPGVAAGMYFPRTFCPGAGIVVKGEILHGSRHFAGEIAFIHGADAWSALDYADTSRAQAMIGELLVILACTVAPAGVVLYGDFFTPEWEAALREHVKARLSGQFDLKLTCESDMAQDMERGAARLAMRRLRELLRKG